MSGFFVPSDNINGSEIYITGQDVNHIKNVLRLRAGDVLKVNDSRGYVYECRLRDMRDEDSRERLVLDILTTEKSDAELPVKITLFQGLPKADKMELIIQKAVELGVNDIYPVINERSVVKLDEKKAGAKCERWNKISEAAAKQSGRAIIPEIHQPVSYKKAVELAKEEKMYIMLPYENAEGMKYSDEVFDAAAGSERCAVFIGPEGGFSLDEVEIAKKSGAKAVSLGHRILRTETAGLFVLSVLGFKIETKEKEGI